MNAIVLKKSTKAGELSDFQHDWWNCLSIIAEWFNWQHEEELTDFNWEGEVLDKARVSRGRVLVILCCHFYPPPILG